MKLERDVKRAIKKMLVEKHPEIFSYWPAASVYGRAGIPDLVICCCGLFIAVEVKAPGKSGNVSNLQKLCLESIRNSGGHAIVVSSDEGIGRLSELLSVIEAAKKTC